MRQDLAETGLRPLARRTGPSILKPLPPWRRLAVIAVALPAAIVACDMVLVRVGKHAGWPIAVLVPMLAFLVFQVALLGWAVGRKLQHALLGLAVYVWVILQVDLLIVASLYFDTHATFPADHRLECMAFAFASGQIGLLTLWGVLGRMPWPWRVPLFGVLLCTAIASIWQAPRWLGSSAMWGTILAAQSLVVFTLCVAMRGVGFRLVESTGAPTAAGRREIQFGLRHILYVMTIISPVILLARGVDLLFVSSTALRCTVLGLAMGALLWIAIVAALGQRGWAGLLVLAIAPTLIGASLTWFTGQWVLPTWSSFGAERVYIDFQRLQWLWIAWAVLAAWFQAALLSLVRFSGYRLAWHARPGPTG